LEAKSLGSSAALVIARAVPPTRLAELLEKGREIGLEIVLEIRNEAELDLALSLGAQLIGVNNRDLETLSVDIATMDRLLPLIPRSCTAIAESGLGARADVERAAAAGADAVLIGGSLSASDSPQDALRSLAGIKRVKNARQN
jgi:indole-3-glycerol phosphate synthase